MVSLCIWRTVAFREGVGMYSLRLAYLTFVPARRLDQIAERPALDDPAQSLADLRIEAFGLPL